MFLLDMVQLGPKPLPVVRQRGSPLLTDRRMRRDLRLLARMISVYCQAKHAGAKRKRVRLKDHEIELILDTDLTLCETCEKLLVHALVKRSTCPLHPKPACKHCPEHCYHPAYRQQIREVMAFSGRRLVLSGRIDYLLRLFF